MTSLSIEEENYVKMGLLLTGISARALRVLFDSVFFPPTLHADLSKETTTLKDMRRKKVINQRQWDLLFPKYPDVPTSNTFDVTLIITLLRNLAHWKLPLRGFDILPSPTETTPASDLARIKYYRNLLAHLDDAKIANSFFNSAWVDLSEAIGRIGGQYLKKECDQLKAMIIDQTNKAQILQIEHAKVEIQSLQGLEKRKNVTSQQEPLTEIKKLKTEQNEGIPKNIKGQQEPLTEIKKLKREQDEVIPKNIKEWFFKLPIICDGFVVDCIIDKRVQSKYQALEKVIRRKELSNISDKMHCKIDFSVLDFLSNIEFEQLFIFQTIKPKNEVDLTNDLHNAIKANQTLLCRYILTNFNKRATIPHLDEALDTAIETKQRDTIKFVTSRIIEEFFQMHKEVLERKTSIWLGIECSCMTAKDSGYENCLCSSSKPKIIIERYNSNFEDTSIDKKFSGFSTRIIDFIESHSTEGSIVANTILEKSESILIKGKISGKVAKVLFRKHCNLSSIYPSSMKSKGFKHPGSHKIEDLNCINLVCKVKGVIPVGETHFPLEIEGVQTDVLEGATHFLGTLRIGDVVEGNDIQAKGTVGGFVKYYGLDTFLTCAHVVFGNDNVFSITKEEIHLEHCHMMKHRNISDVTECILIRHIFEHDNVDPSETSIDAALAVIKTGDLNMFNIANDDQTRHFCSGLGLSSPYLNYNAIDPVILRDARAFCGISGNQRASVSTTVPRNVLISIPLHIQSGHMTMFNQICLYGMEFQRGDSGTCIYVDTPGCFNRQTGCIGMMIGRSTCGHIVLTPMKEILKKFGL